MRAGIQWVLKNHTSYEVAKVLGINSRTINRYQNGESPIENMLFGTAEKIYNYYLGEVDKMILTEREKDIIANMEQDGFRRFDDENKSEFQYEVEKPSQNEYRVSKFAIMCLDVQYFSQHEDVIKYIEKA